MDHCSSMKGGVTYMIFELSFSGSLDRGVAIGAHEGAMPVRGGVSQLIWGMKMRNHQGTTPLHRYR